MEKKRKTFLGRLVRGLGWTALSLAGLLLILQLVLSGGPVTKLVNRFAAEYVEGELSFSKVSVNLFRHFPSVSVSLDDALLTYPHERYAEAEASHPDIVLLRSGRGETIDTLASFRRLSLAINPWALVSGTIDIRHLNLEAPRAFVKFYDDGRTNLDILPLSSDKEETDSSSSSLPSIRLRHIRLNDRPDIVFCDTRDTLHARLLLGELSLKGNVSTEDPFDSKGSLDIDALKVFGRMRSDTLLFSLDKARLKARSRKLTLEADACLNALTRSFGRLSVPLELSAVAAFPEDSVTVVDLQSFLARLGGIPLSATGQFAFRDEGIYMDAEAAIDGCELAPLLKDYGPIFWEGARDVGTDARVTLTALAQGCWSSDGRMPELAAELVIPRSSVSYTEYSGTLEVDINAEAVSDGPVNASVDIFNVDIPGLQMGAKGSAADLAGRDPKFAFDADFAADLPQICNYLPADSGYSADGLVEACFFGNIRASQLNMADFAKADVSGLLLCDSLRVSSSKDSLEAAFSGVELTLAARGNKTDDSVRQGARMLALSLDLDSLYAAYKDVLRASASRVGVVAQNSADFLDERKKADFYPFMGELSIGRLRLRDSDSCSVVLRNSSSSFRISPKPDNRSVPVLKLSSRNGALFLRGETLRAGLKDFSLEANAAMNSLEKRLRRNAVLDSLARVYPDTPRDSLFAKAFRLRGPVAVPEWMQDEELKKQDIKFSLSEDLKKYYREWDIKGRIDLSRAFLATPRFPLRNTVSDFRGSFTNDRVNLESFTLRSGSSDISAKGSVSGLRRALLRNGTVDLDLDISSDMLQVNELLNAYDAGRRLDSLSIANLNALDDDEYQNACVENVSSEAPSESDLIVVPGNVDAHVNLEAKRIVYSTLDIDWMESEIAMKERCLQIANTVATSNMGDIYFEAFYSTRTRKNIKCGFYLNLVDITAEKVIELVPQVDTIMPMLKSFYGMLDCTVAATAAMDENMNILIPSASGVTRIVGKDLEIRNDADISKIAKLLMFKNKKIIHVDEMSVEGLLQDSCLEIFPFMLNVDRYRLAMSGIQNMDSSFKYHVSVIRSPLLFKFGINLSGTFDDWKFRLGKAKYRSAKKVPAFTKVIDQTTMNLTNSIHTIFDKGVDAAVSENSSQQAISDYKQSLGYVSAAEEPLDTLEGKEARFFEEYESMSQGVSALGLDLDSLDVASFDLLDEQTRSSLDSLGVNREFLLKREENQDDED